MFTYVFKGRNIIEKTNYLWKRLINKIWNLFQTKVLYLILIYNFALILIYSLLKPNILNWLFDDAFAYKTGLLPFIDFKVGYPPLGKLPYTILFMLFKNEPIVFVLFNIFVLNIMLHIFYVLINNLSTLRTARILTLAVALNPLIIWMTICYPRPDLLAISSFLACIYAITKKDSLLIGVFASLGFLLKIYPVLLIVPSFFIFRSCKEKIVLLSSFFLVTFLISLPFLALDPFMYISVFDQHLGRGPAESIVALLDGYYSHTGVHHPTYENAIYTWQFISLYQPSPYDHFRYAWNNPFLKYVPLLLQISSFFTFSLMVRRKQSEVEMLRTISLALYSYLIFSSILVGIAEVLILLLAIFATLGKRLAYQVAVVASLTVTEILRRGVWFPTFAFSLPFNIKLSLLITVTFTAIVFSTIFILCGTTHEE